MVRTVLIQPDSPWAIDPLASHPALGLLYLSAYLKENGVPNVEVIDLTGGVDFWDYAASISNADIVGFYSTTPHFPLVANLRERFFSINPDALYVIGGPHPTVHRESCIQAGFDEIVVGEGERAILLIVKGLMGRPGLETSIIIRSSQETVKHQIIHRYPPIKDLDSLPFPDRDAVDIYRYKYVKDGIRYTSMICSRGCLWGRCAFCCQTWPKPARFRSPENCVEEMKVIRDKYGFEGIYFYDDCFNIHRRWLSKLCKLMKPLEMKFRCLIRADITRKQVRELVAAGCVDVFIGQESGSDTELKTIDKGITAEQGLKAVRYCTEEGLKVRVGLIIGLPGASHKTAQETRQWLKSTRKINSELDFDYTICTVYPGSAIWNHPEKYDIAFEKRDWSKMIYKRPVGSYEGVVSTSHLSAEEILGLQREIEEEFGSWGLKLARKT